MFSRKEGSAIEPLDIRLKRSIMEGYADWKDFGLQMATAKIGTILSGESLSSLSLKHRVILRYLKKHFEGVLKAYIPQEESHEYTENAPIWVLWWSGEDTMPAMICLCHASKKRHCGNHPLILLNQYNIRDYVDFPAEIWQQYEKGMLRIQHLADMIRVQLIRRYGGLWLDASVFCGQDIPESCFERSLFSLRGQSDPRFVSDNQWTTFVIGGYRNNILCCFLDDFFQEYCLTQKRFIDYYMFDCAIALAHEHIPAVKHSLDILESYEGDCYWLHEHLNTPMHEIGGGELPLFSKVGWRGFEKPISGTLYEKLIKDAFGKK